TSLDARTIGVLDRAGRIVAVGGDRELASGITILPSPGETPGHQSVRITSEGKTLYCVGDLYHHRLEVEHPSWAVPWADAPTIRGSRSALVHAALAENALLVATHIGGVGRLVGAASAVSWKTA
ncbi:MAG TPA: hypothetical protein VKT80_04225, partial [Chloroflexota bacterium]|nr:hypothetical protein [Chloroflexota bacterium]